MRTIPYRWIMVAAGAVIGCLAIGAIFSLPVFLRPMADATGWSTTGISTAMTIGFITSALASMIMGSLSDRIGRRPVLLISLGGAVVNYLLLAFAPSLWLLFLGRAIAGLTSANTAVAAAFITDISAEDTRARRFGLMSAMFGIGFIAGPVTGGFLGDHWLRLPFIAAALLNGCNFLLALFVLPETRKPTAGRFDPASLNPLRPLRWALSMKGMLPVILIFFLFSFTGEAYGVSWALWGHDVFGWNGFWIGLSLGTFGICQTLTQIFLPGPVARR